jgi:hypothetical protein
MRRGIYAISAVVIASMLACASSYAAPVAPIQRVIVTNPDNLTQVHHLPYPHHHYYWHGHYYHHRGWYHGHYRYW